jgi:hypothetical protein
VCPQRTTTTPTCTSCKLWNRLEAAEILADAEAARALGHSGSAVAARLGVPRSTLQHWLARKDRLDTSPGVADFFESPDGQAFLHLLVVAAHIEFSQVGACGVDRICAFLDRSGLSVFVAASHGAQHEVCGAIQELVIEFGQTQREVLAGRMVPKEITACHDETFHPEVCLVAIEPLSDFVLLEAYSEHRDGQTWTEALAAALSGLPVTVVQAASDEAKGLLAHIRDGLGAHQAPDLWHMQHELAKAACRPLCALRRAAASALSHAQEETAAWRAEQSAYWSNPRPPGRPLAFDLIIERAEWAEEAARQAHETAEARCRQAREALRALGAAYHPCDLATGALRTAAELERLLLTGFQTFDRLADEVGLAEAHRRRIEKARRILPKMVATLAFWHASVGRCLATLDMAPAAQETVHSQLIPGLYLARASRQARTAAERRAIRAVSDELLARARAPDDPLADLPPRQRREVERVAAHCAGLFVRTTSCVEGRNGQLALRHHHLHRLTDRRLRALTVVRNYYIRRPDGTTAAERFFAQPHDDLFDWVADRLELPPRPRSRRPVGPRQNL